MKTRVPSTIFVHISLGVTVLLVLLPAMASAQATSEDDYIINLAARFPSMNRSEHLRMWHTDCHRRCRDQLEPHVALACAHDPYRVMNRASRSQMQSFSNLLWSAPRQDPYGLQKRQQAEALVREETERGSLDDFPFLSRENANSFLINRIRRSSTGTGTREPQKSITAECCYKGCVWEEYAEYCHGHSRTLNQRHSMCLTRIRGGD